MSGFKFDMFGGLYPRTSESLLPPTAATVAQNCDFGYGELRNTKDGYLVQTVTNSPQSIYTDDGLKFYTWPFDVNAVKSPMAADTFDRIYFTTPTDFRVTQRAGMSTNGGQPGASYRVGVPRPAAAPVLSVTGLPDLANATLSARFHYEYAGVKYQEQAITLTEVEAKKRWTFTPPKMATGDTNPVGQFIITGYRHEVSQGDSGETLVWTDLQQVPITVTSATTFTLESTSGTLPKGSTLSGVEVKDQFGLTHELETLFSMSQYAILKSNEDDTNSGDNVNSNVTPTPEQAFPVIRLTAVDPVTNNTIFDIYSANSSLNRSGMFWKLDILKNDGQASYSLALSSEVPESSKETRAYRYTYVNTYGEEGPPSAPALITTATTLDVVARATLDAQTGDYAPIKEIRFYRTPTGSEIADYFYDGSVTVLGASGSTFTFTSKPNPAGLNEPLASHEYYPPNPLLVGLMQLPNGILCAWKGDELHFSEAFKPWAWPPKYVKRLGKAIVNGIAHGAGVLVTTAERAVMFSGVSPDAMSETKIGLQQAGATKHAIADVGGAIAYASNDGIVVVSGGQATLDYSEQFFTRDTWRRLYGAGLSSMRFAVWDGRLIVYSSTTAFTAFLIRLDEAKGAMADLPGFSAACTFVSPVADQCYYAAGTGLYQFAGGSDKTAAWKSKEIVIPVPLNLGFAEVICNGAWTVKFYSNKKDGSMVLRRTKAVTGNAQFRLPDGFKSDRWQIQVEGTGRFREIRVAETARGLREL
jgi:hypothetical protein